MRPIALKGAYEPMRQESVSSDNDYSEEQYNAQRQERFSRGGHPESEEDKKEKRCCCPCDSIHLFLHL